MCGIAGTFGAGGDVGQLEAMVAAQGHRGPDATGTHVDSTNAGELVGLGHNRLSIVDLSDAGIQPMTDPSRPLLDRLQRRDLQLPRAEGRASGLPLPDQHRHRGDPGRVRTLGRGLPGPIHRDVQLPALGRAREAAAGRPRPLREEATLLSRPARRGTHDRQRDPHAARRGHADGARSGDVVHLPGTRPPRERAAHVLERDRAAPGRAPAALAGGPLGDRALVRRRRARR